MRPRSTAFRLLLAIWVAQLPVAAAHAERVPYWLLDPGDACEAARTVAAGGCAEVHCTGTGCSVTVCSPGDEAPTTKTVDCCLTIDVSDLHAVASAAGVSFVDLPPTALSLPMPSPPHGRESRPPTPPPNGALLS